MLICITLILLIVRIVVIVIPKEAFTNNNINDACSDQFKWSKLIGLHRQTITFIHLHIYTTSLFSLPSAIDESLSLFRWIFPEILIFIGSIAIYYHRFIWKNCKKHIKLLTKQLWMIVTLILSVLASATSPSLLNLPLYLVFIFICTLVCFKKSIIKNNKFIRSAIIIILIYCFLVLLIFYASHLIPDKWILTTYLRYC